MEHLNCLLVEDDQVDRKSVCRLLDGFSCQTETAVSLEEAKDLARRRHFDAVILDLGLPDAQGVDSVIEFQASVPELPIVVLSGLKDDDTALRSVDLGAEDYLSKDKMSSENLKRAIRFAIERHRHKTEIFKNMDDLRISLDSAVIEASTDLLTGLPNRRGLQSHLRRLAAAYEGAKVVVGIMDLDHFKKINDEHGHHIGDMVLREFARRLQQDLRARDFAARVGGDEFVVVFAELHRDDALALGRRIIHKLADRPLQCDGKSIALSATMSLREMEPSLLGISEILIGTQELLAKGKAAGRNRVESSWDALPGHLTKKEKETELEDEEHNGTFPGRLEGRIAELQPLMIDGAIGYHIAFGLGKAWASTGQAVGRARLAGRLEDYSLDCIRWAQRWRLRNNPATELHLDLEADAVTARVAMELKQIFPSGPQRNACVLYFHAEFSEDWDDLHWAELLALRKAGFQLGTRELGAGASVLENLLYLRPEWIRVSPALTLNAGRYASKTEMLRNYVDVLRPLGAKLVAEASGPIEDIHVLNEMGFHAHFAKVDMLRDETKEVA